MAQTIFDQYNPKSVDDIEDIYGFAIYTIIGYDVDGVKDVVMQRCIVHLIRNSIKYVPSKDYKAFTAQLGAGRKPVGYE